VRFGLYRQHFAKCVLEACGSQATTACGNLNLCAGLPAGIEGAVHAVAAVEAAAAADAERPGLLTQEEQVAAQPQPNTQDFMSDEEPDLVTDDTTQVTLLVDAQNGFIELGRVQLLPPRGAADCALSGRPVLRHPLRGPAFHDSLWSGAGPPWEGDPRCRSRRHGKMYAFATQLHGNKLLPYAGNEICEDTLQSCVLAARKLGDAVFPETVRFIQDSEVGVALPSQKCMRGETNIETLLGLFGCVSEDCLNASHYNSGNFTKSFCIWTEICANKHGDASYMVIPNIEMVGHWSLKLGLAIRLFN
jgi:hypothetical protein